MPISEKQLAEDSKDIPRRIAGRHHLTGQVFTMTREDRAAHNNHLDGFLDSMKPQGALEITLAHAVAQGFWRLHRAEAMEENTFALEAENNEHRIECMNPQITESLLQAMAFFSNAKTFALLALYEQRIHRKAHKDLATLLDVQARREKKRALSQTEKVMTAAAGRGAELAEAATCTEPTGAQKEAHPLSFSPDVPSAA